ncbi:MAG: aminoacyl-histidine dipeptidase [Candidatus Neomarinimicrobiota bacterium]
MKAVIEGLKPESLWRYFAELSRIPRESKNEAAVMTWIESVSKKLNLSYKKDEVGNIVISKPASPGYENRTPVVLQGHVDMVCEKNSDTIHDFQKDQIELVRDGEYMRANGTTLGADNGIGVAAALAVLEDKTLAHPPLEALFTIDEETGLTGANFLKPGFVKGKILLNGDSEEDGALYVGCAGGKQTDVVFDIAWEKAPQDKVAVALKISGLLGGHSGLDIDQGRANAIKQLNRIVWKIAETTCIRLSYLDGGSKHNAIPREATYRILVAASDLEKLTKDLAGFEMMLNNEYKGVERGIKLTVEKLTEYPTQVFTKEFQARVLNCLYAIPHGVKRMSPSIKGLVQTSTNAAIVRTVDNQIRILTSQRSSIASEIQGVADKVTACGRLAGAEVTQGGGYPSWTPNMDSKILALMKNVYADLFGVEPHVKAIHAGLECGIIGATSPGMDMISFGPTILGAHSPDERVEIKTVENFWRLLVETLKRIE